MLGLLLNALKNSYKLTEDLSTVVNMNDNFYGNGTIDYTVSGHVTGQTLAESGPKTLSFRNLTVNSGGSITPIRTLGGEHGVMSTPNLYHPLIIRCSGTLRIAGSINGDGYGCVQSPNSNKHRRHLYASSGGQYISMPMDGFCRGIGDSDHYWGLSANPHDFLRWYTFGLGKTFLDGGFFLTGVGGGVKDARHTRHGKWHVGCGNTSGLNTSGGAWMSAHSKQWDGGACGGFLALYFNKLIYKRNASDEVGQEYGQSALFPIERISCNGNRWGNNGNAGGGCIVIAARTIEIIGNGRISCDATGFDGSRSKLCYMNNLPQLCQHQSDYYVCNTYGDIKWGNPGNDTYYAYRGAGNTYTAFSNEGTQSQWYGGAGLCFGYRLNV